MKLDLALEFFAERQLSSWVGTMEKMNLIPLMPFQQVAMKLTTILSMLVWSSHSVRLRNALVIAWHP